MVLKLVALLTLLSVVTAQYGHHYGPAPGHASHGYHGPPHDYHAPIPYDYGYDVKDDHGNKQFRKESSDGKGAVKGSYGYVDAHGIHRQVDYVADHHGFRAQVKTNEPGTANQNPAAVGVHSSAPVHGPAHVPVHAPVYAAPAHAPVYAAPAHAPVYAAPAHYAPVHHGPHYAPSHAIPYRVPKYGYY